MYRKTETEIIKATHFAYIAHIRIGTHTYTYTSIFIIHIHIGTRSMLWALSLIPQHEAIFHSLNATLAYYKKKKLR